MYTLDSPPQLTLIEGIRETASSLKWPSEEEQEAPQTATSNPRQTTDSTLCYRAPTSSNATRGAVLPPPPPCATYLLGSPPSLTQRPPSSQDITAMQVQSTSCGIVLCFFYYFIAHAFSARSDLEITAIGFDGGRLEVRGA